jgi:hypothetical protein
MSIEVKLNGFPKVKDASADIDATKDKNPVQVLQSFIESAPRGSKAVYCRGPFLESYSLGEFARKMYLKGHCYLVQRRIQVGRSSLFEYIMVKR